MSVNYQTVTCTCGLRGQPTEPQAKLFVTQERIANGKRFKPMKCPVGDAWHAFQYDKYDEKTWLQGIIDGSHVKRINTTSSPPPPPPPSPSKVSACAKKRFMTQHLADVCLRDGYSSYACGDCDGWHHTSQGRLVPAHDCTSEQLYSTRTKRLSLLRDKDGAVNWISIRGLGERETININLTDARFMAKVILDQVPDIDDQEES